MFVISRDWYIRNIYLDEKLIYAETDKNTNAATNKSEKSYLDYITMEQNIPSAVFHILNLLFVNKYNAYLNVEKSGSDLQI
jgi:hypothetical protein